ncbi:hypothetical protein C8R42DRAFT_643485 [Lentinula raphanica]|nr:hypothetical protein C8R42DRAFT_643485 [Lentinula raphanica]
MFSLSLRPEGQAQPVTARTAGSSISLVKTTTDVVPNSVMKLLNFSSSDFLNVNLCRYKVVPFCQSNVSVLSSAVQALRSTSLFAPILALYLQDSRPRLFSQQTVRSYYLVFGPSQLPDCNVWSTVTDRYSLCVDEDDIISIRRGKVVNNRGDDNRNDQLEVDEDRGWEMEEIDDELDSRVSFLCQPPRTRSDRALELSPDHAATSKLSEDASLPIPPCILRTTLTLSCFISAVLNNEVVILAKKTIPAASVDHHCQVDEEENKPRLKDEGDMHEAQEETKSNIRKNLSRPRLPGDTPKIPGSFKFLK